MTEYAPSAELGLILPIPETGQQWSTQKYIVDNFTKVDVRAASTRGRLEKLEQYLRGTAVERAAFYGADPTTPTDRAAFANTYPMWFNEDKGYWQQYYCQFDDPGAGTAPARETAGWAPHSSDGRVQLSRFTVGNNGGAGTVVKQGVQARVTNAAHATIDGVFTTDFEQYEIEVAFLGASADSDVNLQLRQAGVTDASGSYHYSFYEVSGNNLGSPHSPNVGTTSVTVGRTASAGGGRMSARVFNPMSTTRQKQFLNHSIDAGGYYRDGGGRFTVLAKNCDGFVISLGGAITWTAVITVYGII